jgi:putative membrane-bound dehydrogenase-like protein
MLRCFTFAVAVAFLSTAALRAAEEPKPIKILFLGDDGHHKPNDRYRQLQPIMAKRGIDLQYTDKVESLNPTTLAPYDGLLIYANTTKISADQEKALLDYVESGKGFIPIHCASYCFLNSPKYIALVGAQFKSHNTGTFRTVIAEPDHPIMKGYGGFESWDETYVHTKHNEKGRTVLEYRMEGERKEPWTWVRTQGKGRVFYTAWGHDERTWGNPGFQALLERGIRWAVGQAPKETPVLPDKPEKTALVSPFDAKFPFPEMTPLPKNAKPFEYDDVGKKIPNYQPRGGREEPKTQMQRPLSPDESMKHMVAPKGFHVELFADEKDLGGKPICMTWDERGRLWCAITMDYPNELQPEGQGRDKIVICEDTKGTGRADKFTVFADKLSIPTSITFARGGVIVYNGLELPGGGRGNHAAQTLFLKSTKGDDKADVRQVLFGTWNEGDTHGGPSNMQYGLDNWIWGMQGYNNSRLALGGEAHTFRQGFYHFKPDGSKMEFLRSTSNNTWGFGMSEEGIIFGSTANGCPSVYLPIPNRYYESVRGWAPSLVLQSIADSNRFRPITDKVRQVDFHGGYTAAAGHALYTARVYPKEYWNRVAFVNDPTGHLVGAFVLRRDGSDFHSTNSFNLFASDDEWTAPIMSEVGPDGNVWMIDWYNFIVQHNPTPNGFRTGKGAAYESDLRDKKHGRIYRLVYDGAKKDAKPYTLADATPEKMVETLKSDNLFWRRHAQRLLVERGKQDVLPALIEAAKDQSVDEIGLNVGVIHALWTMHGLGALDGKNADASAVAVAALKHKSAGVRRNAVQVLPSDVKSVQAILAAGLTQDDDPQVRLLALLALADQPATAEAGKALVAALLDPQNAKDKWIPDAAAAAAAKNSEQFLKGASATKEPNAKMLTVVAIVAEHYARGGPVDSIGGVIASLAEADPKIADAVVRGLAKGWPASATPKIDDILDQNLAKLIARVPPERRGALVKMATAWGSRNLEKYAAAAKKTLLDQVKNEALGSEERINAARELVGQSPGEKNTVQTLLDLITPQAPSDVAAGFLQALQATEAPGAGRMILERLPNLTPSVRAAGLSVLLSRTVWTKDLLASADQGKVQLADLSLDQKQALTDHADRAIREQAKELLKRGGALPNPDREIVLQELLPITKETGDAKAGKEIFVKNCSKCHVHSGEGTRIGPDLTGMAVHPKDHLLIDIIDPSRSVEANFRAYRVTLVSGRILTGLLASESKTAIEIFDAEGKKQTILRQDIDELDASTKSLMPDGFEKQIGRKGLTDLLEFLTKRGKYLPLPIDKVATIVSTRGMFYDEANRGERLVFDDWKPKTFEGVPFILVDPQGDRSPNVIMLYSPNGKVAAKMPKTVSVPCNTAAKSIHLLSGVSGWGYSYSEKGTVSMIVRLHYADGKTEDHALKNGEHFADYIQRVDVPGSKFAFDLAGKQMRYLTITPERREKIETIEFVKGPDSTAPIVMAVTVEVAE